MRGGSGRCAGQLVLHAVAVGVLVRGRVVGEGVEEVEDAVVVLVLLGVEALFVSGGRLVALRGSPSQRSSLSSVSSSPSVSESRKSQMPSPSRSVGLPLRAPGPVDDLDLVLPAIEVAVALGVHDDEIIRVVESVLLPETTGWYGVMGIVDSGSSDRC